MYRLSRLLFLTLLLTACGDVTEEAETEDVGADVDANDADDADDADAVEPDTPEPVVCDGDRPSGNFTLFDDAPDTQIHAATAFDGETLWVTYNLPDERGEFDVWIAGFDCAGQQTVSPRRVNTTDFNDVDPAIAAQPGQVIVAWGADSGMQPTNLSLRYRRMASDGTFLDAEDRVLDHDANAWMPSLQPGPEGTWYMAGVAAGETEFKVFLATVDADGNVGERTTYEYDEPGTQAGPSLLVRGDEVWLAWSHDGEEIRLATAGGIETFEGRGPLLGWGTDGPLLSWTEGQIAVVRDLEREVHTRFAEPNKQLHSPVTAGEVTAWYRQIRGIRNQLYWAGADGAQTWIDTEDAVAPYGIALTDMGDGSYFIAWSEGTSPAFRIYGTFLTP